MLQGISAYTGSWQCRGDRGGAGNDLLGGRSRDVSEWEASMYKGHTEEVKITKSRTLTCVDLTTKHVKDEEMKG